MEHVVSAAHLRRIGWIRFPAFELVMDEPAENHRVLAKVGRGGWFKVYFGRGRRIELADGTKWRLTAMDKAGSVVPVITSETGKVAYASTTGYRSYGISGRDFAYNLYRDQEPGIGKRATWLLVEFDNPVGTVGATAIQAESPIPVAVALLCMSLVKFGVPGESKLGIPATQW